ncbi:triphosphoribosyl-dephospho-CoA synthase MdcB [Sporosarcina sp. P2]|uniref:triphosphoribosyl-dephospho-CoA synthase n=1 Tax=Sporosarcina sp. P2 TaxID=2048251 RepID=UPI000C16AD85|nr:triphosphoribosyl-dephospho-CoA synthase [Sporosarcina sp. P2]PID04233.1 triphosphoribosyl-dephospho-CoA synthase MdcB [Sporosarcina sp. P2]
MRQKICKVIADEAVAALFEEVELTPKPGLVDLHNNGSHVDLNHSLMCESALSLHETFYNIALLHYGETPTTRLREQFGEIGRTGEQLMFTVTNDVNTHKGAIWSIGLICAAIARRKGNISFPQVLEDAAELAKLPDRMIPNQPTNGLNVKKKYGMPGAREEAQYGFPHIRKYSYPTYEKARFNHNTLEAKLLTLLALISNLNDTCLVHRGGLDALEFAKTEAENIMKNFSIEAVERLDREFQQSWISPGGSADLLATTFFISNWITKQQRRFSYGEVSVQVSSE